ncbi:MAG: iron-containing redox enzyme family protein [Bradymonadaceae bacterium]
MELKVELLEHPFYQAWKAGDVTVEQLSEYAEAYQELMDQIPELWAHVVEELGLGEQGREVVAEETEHAQLWTDWRMVLPAPEDAPRLDDLLSALAEMNASELAGALHAYEVQQPDVAETKREGLLEYYGFDEDQVEFFDEHAENEDEHIALGEYVREHAADREAFDRGFERGARLIYDSLDQFQREDAEPSTC